MSGINAAAIEPHAVPQIVKNQSSSAWRFRTQHRISPSPGFIPRHRLWRYRVGDGRHGIGFVHDHAGAGAILWWLGAGTKRAFRHGPVRRDRLPGLDFMGGRALQLGIQG